MSTVLGYMRLSVADQLKPARAVADRAAVEFAQLRHAEQGFTLGEIVTDAADQHRLPVAARPGGIRVTQLAQRGDVIILPTAGRLARSVRELRDTLDQWHARGVIGVVIDLGLNYAQAESRASVKLLAAGEILGFSLRRNDKLALMTADEQKTVNRWGLFVAKKTKKASIVPAEFDLAAKCAGWKAAGASAERIALHLTRTREQIPVRWTGRNRTFFGPAPFWHERQIERMVKGYYVVSDLYARGVCKAPAGYSVPLAEPTPLPERN